VGRMGQDIEPMKVALNTTVLEEDWFNASIAAGNLSGLELTLGNIEHAVAHGKKILVYAERSARPGVHQLYRSYYADALHQAGHPAEARRSFRETEVIQNAEHPAHPFLYSAAGFMYCDVLLTQAERTSWQLILKLNASTAEL